MIDNSFVGLLRLRSATQPDKRVYTFLSGGESASAHLTYRELDLRARVVAAKLQSCVKPGERVLLLYPPGLDFTIAFFGCLYAGIVAVPAYPPRRNRRASRIEAIVADADAKAILTVDTIFKQLTEKKSDIPVLSIIPCVATDTASDEISHGSFNELPIASDSIAFLQYTSGSTGKPKGVMVSHANLMYNSSLICKFYGHDTSSVGVIWLPPYHDMGLIGGILQPLYGDFPVVLMPSNSFLQKPVRWLQAISRYRATTSGGPDFAFNLLCQKVTPEQLERLDLSSWTVAFTGAEPIRAQTLERFSATFSACGFRHEAFYPCYGMAESTLIISGGKHTEPPVIRHIDRDALQQNKVAWVKSADSLEAGSVQHIVGCGQTDSDQAIVIVDPDAGEALDDEEIGEIWVQGRSIAQGYWKKPVETQQVFRARLKDGREGCFLRTGDLGFLSKGELFITGRLKDIVIVAGRNYYPQDIESSIENCNPALRAGGSAAFSVEVHGIERLVVVQEVERRFVRNIDMKRVLGDMRQAIAAEHTVQLYSVVLIKPSSLPKTSSGKVKRYACKQAFLNGDLNVVEEWSQMPYVRKDYIELQAQMESLQKQLKVNHV